MRKRRPVLPEKGPRAGAWAQPGPLIALSPTRRDLTHAKTTLDAHGHRCPDKRRPDQSGDRGSGAVSWALSG